MNWRSIASAIGALALACGAPLISPAQVPIGATVAADGNCPSGNAVNTGVGRQVYESSKGALCISGTISASTTGFTPSATGTPISVTTGGVTGTLPTGTVVTAYNTGATNDAFCKLGASATTSDIDIPPKSWFAFTVGAATQLTCITSTSTTTVNMVGGSGLPTGAGGGGGGSGSNASVSSTGAAVPGSGTLVAGGAAAGAGNLTAATVKAGSTAAAATDTALVVQNATEHTDLGTINTTLGTPMQNSGGSVTANAGTNLNTSLLATDAHLTALGSSALLTDSHFTTIFGTTASPSASCTNPISIGGCLEQLHADATASLPAGSAIVGKFGIDQTTPGTTNGVALAQINAATTLAGNGPTGTGAQRVTQSNDNSSAPVNVSTATTTQIVAASGSTVIHVRSWILVTTLADNVTWESGDTGGSCANPVALTGAMPFAANGGAAFGSGAGDVMVLPSGKALCMLTSAATQISGSVSYEQY